MKKTVFRRFHRRAKCVLSLILSVLFLTGDGFLIQPAAADGIGPNDTLAFRWKKVQGIEDLPCDDVWHPIILSYRDYDDDGYATDYYLNTNGMSLGRTFGEVTDNDDDDYDWGVKTTTWLGYQSDGYIPMLYQDMYENDVFYTLGQSPSDLGIYHYTMPCDANGQVNCNYFISRGVDFTKSMGKGTPGKWTDGRQYTTDLKNTALVNEAVSYYNGLTNKVMSTGAKWFLGNQNESSQAAFYNYDSASDKKYVQPYVYDTDDRYWNCDKGWNWNNYHGGGVMWSIIPHNVNEAFGITGDAESVYIKAETKNSHYFYGFKNKYAQYVSSGTVRIVMTIDGAWTETDTTLQHKNDVIWAEDDGSYDYDNGLFVLWVGTPVKLATVRNKGTGTADVTVPSGSVQNVDEDMLIEANATLVVEPGAVLSIDANLYNNGTIYNYGTIVVQPGATISTLTMMSGGGFGSSNSSWGGGITPVSTTMQSSTIYSIDEPSAVIGKQWGAIYCKGGTYNGMNAEGNFLVMQGAGVAFEEGENLFRLENGATLELNGIMFCPNAFMLADSDLYIRRNGLLVCQYGRKYKHMLPTEYQYHVEPSSMFKALAETYYPMWYGIEDETFLAFLPAAKKMTNIAPASFYVSGQYQLINDGLIKSAGMPIRHVDTTTGKITDITEIEGSGSHSEFSNTTSGSNVWTEEVHANGIASIIHNLPEAGGYHITYEDGHDKNIYANGCSWEYGDAGTKTYNIARSADNWYRMYSERSRKKTFAENRSSYEKPGDITEYESVNYWSHLREYTDTNHTDANLISEGHYEPSGSGKLSDVFVTYYYKDGDCKAGEATVEHRNGDVDVYAFTGKPGSEVLGKQIGKIEKTVNAIGERSSVENVEYTYKKKDGSEAKGELQTVTSTDRVEATLTLGRKTLPVRVNYIAGKFTGASITYTTVSEDQKSLGGYYYKTAEPETFNANTGYATLWRVNDGKGISVCRCKWNAETKSYDYLIGYSSKASYDASKDDYYTESNLWMNTKTGSKTMPNPESFLKGWPY